MKSVCLQGILKQSFSLSPNKFNRIFPTKFNGSSDQSSDADQFNTTLAVSSGPDGALKKNKSRNNSSFSCGNSILYCHPD